MSVSSSPQPSPAPPAIQTESDDNSQGEDSVFDDQDEAQAALQPAISAVASHLTSSLTPAAEKVAALEKFPGGSLANQALTLEEHINGFSSPELSSSPEATPPISQLSYPAMPGTPPSDETTPGSLTPRQPLPSPWHSGPKEMVVKDGRSRHTRGVLESALGHSRQRRSGSAGQEAFKRLQKAFPSLHSSTNLLPSRSSSLFTSSSRKLRHEASSHKLSPGRGSHPPNPPASSLSTPQGSTTQKRDSLLSPSPPTSRPPMLRRVTSDDSLLYHSLSRTSSLGDDEQFHDVRAMVNMRLLALKDSLPDVPNFKMPSLPKLQASSIRSSSAFSNIFPAEPSRTPPALERDLGHHPKENWTALDYVLEDLTGDIVILGGYRGSILRSAEPPHQQLWAPVKLGFNMRRANMEVGLEDEDEENMEKTIIPSGMLQHIGPIDVSRKLFKKLRSSTNCKNGTLRVWDFGYDWRLSPHISSRKLQEFLQKLPSNQAGVAPQSRGALVIAHSLGGLVTRHAVNQRPDLFSGVLYAGVPQRCINILGPFRNGDVVLFNEKLLTAQVNFSIRTSFIFLPEDGFCFIDKKTQESYPIDFYDPQEWIKWHLSPCMQPALPPFNRPQSSPLSSFFPNALRSRSDSKPEKLASDAHAAKERTLAPHMNASTGGPVTNGAILTTDRQRQRYFEYLTRTLNNTRKFRAELAHSSSHQSANAYPPFAVLYGKTIPTVYAAQVNGREAIPCSDCYDDLLFRPGDGVALAKESMLPDGYSMVRGGRISTERGHLTMLGDMPAVGRALEALVRGRKKGIGMGITQTDGA
ncbi:hypothetical protein HJFPF1_03504 [Paramyrothecium foliicola]|nr:hypothetical protein HJFPF1_03504 [Paramyrothecium foliicola]